MQVEKYSKNQIRELSTKTYGQKEGKIMKKETLIDIKQALDYKDVSIFVIKRDEDCFELRLDSDSWDEEKANGEGYYPIPIVLFESIKKLDKFVNGAKYTLRDLS